MKVNVMIAVSGSTREGEGLADNRAHSFSLRILSQQLFVTQPVRLAEQTRLMLPSVGMNFFLLPLPLSLYSAASFVDITYTAIPELFT